eukprot:878376-Amorphochlora_amoeboformis.AAC.2
MTSELGLVERNRLDAHGTLSGFLGLGCAALRLRLALQLGSGLYAVKLRLDLGFIWAVLGLYFGLYLGLYLGST